MTTHPAATGFCIVCDSQLSKFRHGHLLICSDECNKKRRNELRKARRSQAKLDRKCPGCSTILGYKRQWCDECNAKKPSLRSKRWREENPEKLAAQKERIRIQRQEASAKRRAEQKGINCAVCGVHIPPPCPPRKKYCTDCKRQKDLQNYRTQNAKYRAENRERIAEKHRLYHEANRDRKNEYFKQWRKDNPVLAKAQRTRRRARQLEAATEDHCYDLEVYIRDGGQCHLCGHPVSWNMPPFHDASFNLEHVVPYVHGGKHHLDNVACSHQQCNFRKGTRLMEDLDLPFDPPVCLTPPSHTTTGMV